MLVAGVDSSTQSCKVLVVDSATGAIVRSGTAPHPEGTEVNPAAWWLALKQAVAAAGGLQDVAAIGVGGQQHGMVLLDAAGEVVRDALLWNDTRSAAQAERLVAARGADWWAAHTGSVPVASFTVTKLAWVAENDPAAQSAAKAVCLPHDYLTYRLRGGAELAKRIGLSGALTTDRGDASGTGYWSPASGEYDMELLAEVWGEPLTLPTVRGAWDIAGTVAPDVAAELGINPACVISAGSGDNMAAALGLGTSASQCVVSIGTSGTVFAVSEGPVSDASGLVAGFADATGNYLPLACTLNATQVLDRFRGLLGLDFESFDAAALSSATGAGGLTLVPYLQGERTPNRPDDSGTLHGLRLDNMGPEQMARAAVEGVLCSLRDALEAVLACGVKVDSISLIGGGARSEAVRRLAPCILERPVIVPSTAEYVALGMARQAATAFGETGQWSSSDSQTYESDPTPDVYRSYVECRG